MATPIKRHPQLATLSRQHHSVLLFCWKIRQGLNKEIAFGRIAQYIRYFWTKYLSIHFHEEESILFKAAPGGSCIKAIDQHIAIEQSIKAVTSSLTDHPESFSLLADLVEHHVRYEERELYPQLEKQMGEQLLLNVGGRLQETEMEICAETYEDEFWLKTEG